MTMIEEMVLSSFGKQAVDATEQAWRESMIKRARLAFVTNRKSFLRLYESVDKSLSNAEKLLVNTRLFRSEGVVAGSLSGYQIYIADEIDDAEAYDDFFLPALVIDGRSQNDFDFDNCTVRHGHIHEDANELYSIFSAMKNLQIRSQMYCIKPLVRPSRPVYTITAGTLSQKDKDEILETLSRPATAGSSSSYAIRPQSKTYTLNHPPYKTVPFQIKETLDNTLDTADPLGDFLNTFKRT